MIRFIAGCLTIVALVTSCEIQEDFKYRPAGIDGKLGINAWEFIQQNNDFAQLRAAILRTGLQQIYQQEERTFIIPNNTAFNAYLQSGNYSSIDDVPVPILRNMLRYHIVKNRVIFTDPSITRDRPLPYETENGQTMFLSRNNNYIGLINQGTARQWEIRTSNLEPTNGVMHATNFIVYFSAPAIDDGSETTLEQDTIFVLQDAFVAGHTPGDANLLNTNYGAEQLLRPKKIPGSGVGTYDRRAYLMFDFDGFTKPGIVVDMKLKLEVLFSRGGYSLDLYEVPSTNWTESTITGANAPVAGSRITSIQTVNGAAAFNFDITNFYKNETPNGRFSFMLDTEPWPNGVDDLASKEHATRAAPMIIVTLATNVNELIVETNEQATVANGGSFAFDTDLLFISGADPADITFTIDEAPTKGWLVRGADIIGQAGQFTQADLQTLSLLYIHDGESSGTDHMVLSARDRTGAVIEDIALSILIQ